MYPLYCKLSINKTYGKLRAFLFKGYFFVPERSINPSKIYNCFRFSSSISLYRKL
nr:MAG TPA: hypothetical protein [Caudoviricetes sp.]DAQ99444.1 MAG TPA: hypothetical protein [Caudoviricetes sp.]